MLLSAELALATAQLVQRCTRLVPELQFELTATCLEHSNDVWRVALANEAAAVAQTRLEEAGLGLWGTVGVIVGASLLSAAIGFAVGFSIWAW